MKKYIVLFLALASVTATALAVATNTYQIGGDLGVRDAGWHTGVATNTSVMPTEYSWSFGAPGLYPDLSNVVFTVTAVETNDAMSISSGWLCGTNGNATRLDVNDAVLLMVSYSDPDGLLTGLKVDSFGPWWNTGSAEETLFSDGANVHAMTDTDNGIMADYDTTSLTQLTLANTGSWSMLVYTTNGVTTSGLGGFKLEYIANVDAVILPNDPPHGVVDLNPTWKSSRCVKLAEASDFCSAIFTNSTTGENNINRRFYQDSFTGAAVQTGETLTISFTAMVGTNLPINGADRIFRASFWDDDATTANGFSFRADYGNYGGTTLQAGLGNVQSAGYVGTIDLSVDVLTTSVPTNRLENHSDEVDFVITIERTGITDIDFSMSYDNVVLSNSYTGMTFNSIDAIGFRMNSTLDNHLIITNLQVEITNDSFDRYGYWAFYALLEKGVNDGYLQDPDDDDVVNLLEYAWDGDPMTGDAWRRPQSEVVDDGGTKYLNCIYRRRRDAAIRGLTYLVGSSTDLQTGLLTNATVEVGSEVLNADIEFVTNRVSTAVEDKQFMQLKVTIE